MSVSKNFVVKHGLEVNTDLILANANTKRVGIGSTSPKYTLDVSGGIGVTDIYSSGFTTVINGLNIGIGGTTLTALGGGFVGVGTASPSYLLDIRSPVSTGQTALYVQGDLRVTGDINVDDITFDDATVQNLEVTDTLIVGTTGGSGIATIGTLGVSGVTTTQHLQVTGVSTFVGFSSFNDYIYVQDGLNVSGIVTGTSFVPTSGYIKAPDGTNSFYIYSGSGNVAFQGTIGATQLNSGTGHKVVGLAVSDAAFENNVSVNQNLDVSGVTTTQHLQVTGVSTFVGFSTFNDYVNIKDGLNVSGLSTLGVTLATNLTSQQLNVSGLSTFAGITTVTGETLFSRQLNVSGVTTITSIIIGSAVTITSSGVNVSSGVVTANQFVKSGGLSTEFLKADGSTDSNTYLTTTGSGSDLTGIVTSIIAGTGITISASQGSVTVTTSGIGINTEGGVVGTGATVLDFRGAGISTVTVASGIATINITGGGTGTATTLTDDSTTNSAFYPVFTDATSGSLTTSRVSSTKLTFNPSTGNLFVGSGVTVGTAVTINSSGINVSGLSTLGVTLATNLTSQQLNVSGLSTFAGITTVTGETLFSRQLNVSGVSTFASNVVIDSSGILATGIITARNSATQDSISLNGRTGGNGSFNLSLTPTTLAASRTVTFQDVSGTVYVSGGTDVTLADGGTNASLTASNGGIVYSTASAMAILSGTATAGQMLRSGASGAPSWSTATFPNVATTAGTILRADGTNWVASTATYPTTTTINRILFSSAANTIGEITSANTSALVTNSTGVPSFTLGTTANRLLRTDGTTISFAQAALTTDVTGTLPIANGGTNSTATPTNGGIAYGTGTAYAFSAAGSSGQILRSAGAAAPTWSTATFPNTATNAGRVLRANGTNWVESTATFPDTATTTGTILRADGTNWVASTATYPTTTTANRILFSSANNTIGEITSANTSALVTNSTGVPSFTLGTTANRLLRTDGTTVSFAQAALTTDVTGTLPIANGGTNSTATPTNGGIAYGTGTAFAFTAAGTSGQVLTSNGAGAPTWQTAAGGVTIADDTSTNATRYVMFDDITSGSASTVNVSSTKLTFNPSTGNLSATQFTSLSDITQKKNVHPIENALELTKQLQGVRFDWIDNNKPSLGLIAQDVEKVLPELVESGEDGLKRVNYSNMIGLLIETVKEQQVRIEELERKLNA